MVILLEQFTRCKRDIHKWSYKTFRMTVMQEYERYYL